MSSNWEHVALFSTETDKDLKQKNGNIKLNKPILIVCDSDETLEYFFALKCVLVRSNAIGFKPNVFLRLISF